MSKAVAPGASPWARILRIGGISGSLVLAVLLCGLGLAYFDWWMGGWLAVLFVTALLTPAWGLGLLFLSVSMDAVRAGPGNLFLSYAELQIAVFLSSWIARGLWEGRRLARDWTLAGWSAPFLFIVFLSGVLSSSLIRAVPNSLRFAEMFVMAFAVANLPRDPAAPRFRSFLFMASLFYALVGITQFPVVEWGRVYSTFANPNQFAGYLNLVLPMTAALFLSTRRKECLSWGYLSLIVLVAAASTLSRAGFVAGLLGAATVLAVHWRHSGPELKQFPGRLTSKNDFAFLAVNLLIGLLLMVALALIPATRAALDMSFRNLSGRFRGGLVSSFQKGRKPYYVVGWSLWKDHFWLGAGPGNYTRALIQKRDLIRSFREDRVTFRIFVRSISSHVHNLVLQTGVNFGLLGIVTLLYFFWQLFGHLARQSRASPAALGGVGLLVAFFFHNLLDVTFPSLGIEMGILLGIACNGRRL